MKDFFNLILEIIDLINIMIKVKINLLKSLIEVVLLRNKIIWLQVFKDFYLKINV